MEKLPAGGCTQERSQEESSISSPLTLSESACQRTHLLFTEVYFLLYNLVCSLPGALIPGCPQITLAAYDPTTNAVISPLGRPGSWHILWFWPQFQYPPLEKLLISLLKPGTTVIQPLTADTTTCVRLSPAKPLSWYGASLGVRAQRALPQTTWGPNAV